MALLEKDQVRELLPKIGDRLMEHPTTLIGTEAPPKRPCTVVAVHVAHLWYTVEFDNGLRESYKLPKINYPKGGPRL